MGCCVRLLLSLRTKEMIGIRFITALLVSTIVGGVELARRSKAHATSREKNAARKELLRAQVSESVNLLVSFRAQHDC